MYGSPGTTHSKVPDALPACPNVRKSTEPLCAFENALDHRIRRTRPILCDPKQ